MWNLLVHDYGSSPANIRQARISFPANFLGVPIRRWPTVRIRDARYRTEHDIGTTEIGLKSAESDILADIGLNFLVISDFQHPPL